MVLWAAWLIPATILWLPNTGLAADPVIPPPGGEDILEFNDQQDIAVSAKHKEAAGEWVPVKGMPFEDAYRVNLTATREITEHASLAVPINKAVRKGNTVLISFWIRRPKSGGEPGPSVMHVKGDADKPLFEYAFSAYRDWQQHVRAFVAPTDLEPQSTNITIRVGNSGAAVDVADLRLIDYGTKFEIADLPRSAVTYAGRESDAEWRKTALARIERIRKGDFSIEVVDAEGNPASNATVKVEMQRHAFGFGNVVNSELLAGDEASFPYTKTRNGIDTTATWEDAQKYREVIKENFNYATFEAELRPHRWQAMMGDSQGSQRARELFTQQAVPWLQSHDIGIRGHYLAWGAIDYNAQEKKFVGKPDEHRKWLWGHMADVLPNTAEYVTEWDTINHIIGWGKHTYEIEYGGFDIYADIMKEARRLAPSARHTVNEGKVLPNGYKREPYKRVIRFLNENGQAPDTVGFMAHFELTSLTPPEELLSVYDEFGELAPRLQLSEFDVETGDDELLQADYYRDVMIASFSHPNFVSIIQWGFWENAHWKPAAALWRADWSLKPSGKVFVDLVKKDWWTDETLQTKPDGSCGVRGFLGDYQITVEHNGQTITKNEVLQHEGTHLTIQTR